MWVTKWKLQATGFKKNYQATECEDIQVKAEDHGINLVIVHDSSCTFKVPTRYMKLIQEISVIVHEFTSPNKLPLMYQISILRRLLVSICWRKSRFGRAFQPPAPRWIQHPRIQTKNPSEVTYKDQNNTAHTSGANHIPPSKLLTKIRTTQCTHLVQSKTLLRSYWQRSEERSAHINISVVEAPTIEYYYYYYYSILEDASMHNVTMRIVANGFDDALHIAFETLLAAHERWMGSSLRDVKRGWMHHE
jgi:hypothetical protein